ncbi:MAG: SDR family oxidoreductase [Acidimicrobiales bacterium]|jgi:NAD(P)-dependent dehydrogenase (short-subunit alcohol dehydrogenase family)
MMGLLDEKVAVITGAGSGMGKASVKVFVREGAKVAAADISGAEQETAADVGDGVLPVHCDVSKEADVEAAMAAAVEEFGRVDVVLNVAGIADGCALADLTMEFYDRLMDVDLRGVMLGMKHGIRTMLESGGGSIVNWSSVGGLNGAAFTSVYQAAKHGIIGASKSAAIEYGTQGIRVNTICPGFILTEIMAQGAEDFIPDIAAKAALNRAGLPHEVAEVGAFLASDRASFITGAVIPVDGGWSAKLA